MHTRRACEARGAASGGRAAPAAHMRACWQWLPAVCLKVCSVPDVHPLCWLPLLTPPPASAVRPPPLHSCLEVGCGTGYVLASLALLLRSVGAAAQLLGTDVNAAAAAATRATLAAHEVRLLAGRLACAGWAGLGWAGPVASQQAVLRCTCPQAWAGLLPRPHPPPPACWMALLMPTQVASAADVILCDLASALLPSLAGLVDVLVRRAWVKGRGREPGDEGASRWHRQGRGRATTASTPPAIAGSATDHPPGATHTLSAQVFNPPYVPTPDEEVERGGLAAAWAGGARGRRVLDRLLPQLPRLLSPRGEAFVVAVHENDPQGEGGV